MESPCYECPYRKVSCHDRCVEYLEYHDALVEAKRKVREAADAIEYLREMSRKRERRVRVVRHR